jgi:hypothetical protein
MATAQAAPTTTKKPSTKKSPSTTTAKKSTAKKSTTSKKVTKSTTTIPAPDTTTKKTTQTTKGDVLTGSPTTTVAITAPKTDATTTKPKAGATTVAPASKAGPVFIPGAGRVLDLDANQVAKLAAGGKVEADVRGASGLAASGTGSVIVDVTVSNPTTAGKVTLSPVAPDFARTVVNANLTFPAGSTTVTRLAVPVGFGGKVRVSTTTGPSGLTVAVVGWVVNAQAGVSEPSAIPLEPCRLLDTITGAGGLSGEVTPARPFDIPVVGLAKVPPALGGKEVPTGVIVNISASQASGPLDVTIVPSGSQSPALVLSMAPGQVTGGAVVIPVGTDARAAFYVSQNGVQLAVDVVGWIDRDGVAKSGGPC